MKSLSSRRDLVTFWLFLCILLLLRIKFSFSFLTVVELLELNYSPVLIRSEEHLHLHNDSLQSLWLKSSRPNLQPKTNAPAEWTRSQSHPSAIDSVSSSFDFEKKNIYKGGSEEGALNLMKIGRLIDKRSSIRQPLTVVEIIATSLRHRLNHEIDFEGKLSIFKRHSSLLMVLIWFSLISILSSAPRVSKLLSQTKCFNEARNGSDLIL